ncbi:MAG: FAD-binding protein [Actinobacteria bacterium]|nr:FAD-binding protein [Actinomycetota bacterium]
MTAGVPEIHEAPVVVLGSGLAGLAAARELRRLGIDVVVYEAADRVGGMADTHRDEHGFAFDTGAHFITNRFAAAVGIANRCRTVQHYGETVWLRGRAHDYPFGLLRTPHYLGAAVRVRLQGKVEAGNAAERFRAEYGAALADEVAIPLLEQWSGLPAEQLSPAVAEKLPGDVAATMALKLAARCTGRAVAIGYCREAPQSANVWHVYPEDGIAAVCRALAAALPDDVRLANPVERVLVADGRAVGVVVAGREVPAAAVVSTLPAPALARLTDHPALDHLRELRFRAMVFVNVMLRGRDLLPDTLTWTPEPGFPGFRLAEPSRSMPWLAPAGRTLVTADLGAEVGDAVWSAPDDELGEQVADAMRAIVPTARRDYLGCHVLRSPVAYPVFDLAHEAARLRLADGTGLDRLLSVGRNGEFAHLLMEDSYWRTLRRIRALAAELMGCAATQDEGAGVSAG